MIFRETASRFVATLALGVILGCAPGCHAPASHAGAPPAPAIASPPAPATIAERILALEFDGVVPPELRHELLDTIDLAVSRCGPPVEGEAERATAERFFSATDQALIDRGFIFPPRGLVELLHHALKPRTLTASDYDGCLMLPENDRRSEAITRIQAQGGPFHMADCDLTAIITLAAAERLGHPVSMVRIPNHVFVRWSSPTLTMNWDTNIGHSYSDRHYISRHGVTEEGRAHLGWLADMPRDRLISTWLCTIGHWHNRHGRHAAALVAYRRAVRTDPGDFEAAIALAWFLATCEDDALRDAAEAAAIAGPLVALWPRSAWVDTLAAAQAENGDFAAAITTERSAPRVGATGTGTLDTTEPSSDPDDAVRAYSRGMTYREGVAAGLIYEPRELLPYED